MNTECFTFNALNFNDLFFFDEFSDLSFLKENVEQMQFLNTFHN